jgi:hypothetical protein
MASGLKVNYGKSCLMGVNVRSDFVELACTFLNCKHGEVPFKYLGLLVGANPRRIATWEPVLAYLKKRLSLWGKKYISLGGRIVLINSVLNAIPIFFLVFPQDAGECGEVGGANPKKLLVGWCEGG